MSTLLSAQNTNKLNVEGIARLSEVPDEIIVSIDLTVKDSLYQECFNKSMEALKNLKATFKKNGIDPEAIKSKAIVVNEQYEYRHNKRTKIGYVSNIGLEIKATFTQKFSNALLKSLDKEGLEINYRIAFGFSDELKDKLRQKAIELAVADAKQKAETIAKAAGLELGSIANINYGNTKSGFQPVLLTDSEFSEAPRTMNKSFAGINLNPKEQHIQKSINISWNFGE